MVANSGYATKYIVANPGSSHTWCQTLGLQWNNYNHHWRDANPRFAAKLLCHKPQVYNSSQTWLQIIGLQWNTRFLTSGLQFIANMLVNCRSEAKYLVENPRFTIHHIRGCKSQVSNFYVVNTLFATLHTWWCFVVLAASAHRTLITVGFKNVGVFHWSDHVFFSYFCSICKKKNFMKFWG